MKTKGGKTTQSSCSNFDVAVSELNDDQRNSGCKNEKDNLYHAGNGDHCDMGEVIRRWESFRYMN